MSASLAQQPPGRRRDANASRRAILDAAEVLFSERGFDRASMHAIASRAGVSPALPAYFFGGKEGLYRTVMQRLIDAREEHLTPLADKATETLAATGNHRAAIKILIDGYIDFLCQRQALVRLMGREALDGGRRLGPEPRHSLALHDFLARSVRALPNAQARSIDLEQLVISTVALCFFPIEHNDTVLAAMGLDATTKRFAQARKRHVVDVLDRILCD
ncbi:MAG: TetR family transcriptional regulator [Actinobacteria bacterium]|nr:TetR family transcriptional regulator [Actinomycetota bacterium]